MSNYQTPGVYIVEQDAFPNSVVEVATAVPVFIGYTQKADYNGQPLFNTAVKVGSLNDFENFFGKAPVIQYTLTAQAKPAYNTVTLNGKNYSLTVVPGKLFYMYNSMRLFFQNGGGNCYVISMGDYSSAPALPDFQAALALLENIQDPTLIVMPDALLLEKAIYYSNIIPETLLHCETVQSRMGIFDVYDGYLTDPSILSMPKNPIQDFRDGIGINSMNYGVAYFPWVNTTIVQDSELNFNNISGDLKAVLENTPQVQTLVGNIATANTDQLIKQTHQALMIASANYSNLMKQISLTINVLPVAPAMVGIYAQVDSERGVWKAPANVSVNAVTSPVMPLSDKMQMNLNVDAMSGKSINAIRFFTGQGVLVWGARTLDGNSNDWRYINVRRTMIMLEQSIKLAARTYVFEPNDANTWAGVKSMINNFLNDLWKQGALAGSKPDDAFNVAVGLGSTMTGEDILNGYMRITVLVAISHPAEFIVITFEQQMQKS